jgi:hypothetical protein
MEKEIILIDFAGNKTITPVDRYVLHFNSGANVSLDFNDKWNPNGIVCRAWYGEKELEPSPDGSCTLVITPRASNIIWLKPLVLTGTSLSDVKIKAASTQLPQLYSRADSQKQLMSPDIKFITVKDPKTNLTFEIELPQNNVSTIFQESILITTSNKGIVCEPKACNVWVFKPFIT